MWGGGLWGDGQGSDGCDITYTLDVPIDWAGNRGLRVAGVPPPWPDRRRRWAQNAFPPPSVAGGWVRRSAEPGWLCRRPGRRLIADPPDGTVALARAYESEETTAPTAGKADLGGRGEGGGGN